MDIEVVLTRKESSDQGTFGILQAGPLTLYSGELPNRENKPNISCIPKGSYSCIWTYSKAFLREMYLITNVEGRSGIRIHAANFMGDKSKGLFCQLNGCIALGEKLAVVNGQKGIFISGHAVSRFESYLNKKPFKLIIQ